MTVNRVCGSAPGLLLLQILAMPKNDVALCGTCLAHFSGSGALTPGPSWWCLGRIESRNSQYSPYLVSDRSEPGQPLRQLFGSGIGLSRRRNPIALKTVTRYAAYPATKGNDWRFADRGCSVWTGQETAWTPRRGISCR
jgi:hypothetical protein